MIINGATILTWLAGACTGAVIALLWAEHHYEHIIEQIKLINTAHIERSMRADGWIIDHDVFDQDAEDEN